MNHRVRVEITAVLDVTSDELAELVGGAQGMAEELRASPDYPTSDVTVRIKSDEGDRVLLEIRKP